MDDIVVRRILLVEDNPDHAMLAVRALRRHFAEASIALAASAEEAEDALVGGEWDVVIVDYGLPHANGLHVLHCVRNSQLQLPVVMLTGRGDEQTAVAAMKGGAADYVTKTGDYLALLPTTVEAAVRRCRLAADRERLARELAQRNRHLTAVNAVAVAVSRSLRLEEMLRDVVDQVAAIVGQPAAVFLPDEKGTALELATHAGLDPVLAEHFGRRALRACPGTAETVQSGADPAHAVEPHFFSLAPDGEPQGTLAVFLEPGSQLDEHEREMLGTLAHVIGMGVRNSLLFEETRSLSLQDELTGLGNRRLFNIKLESDFQTARRYGTHLALLMLDIDHFKAINDRYGHPAGDCVLRHLAGVLLERSRSSDLTFRYGGEEFTMLLPHAGTEAALRVAERIRRIVAGEKFDACNVCVHITVSIGVGCYHGKMEVPADLVDAADRALYDAKQAGRNRVAASNGRKICLPDPQRPMAANEHR